VKLAGNSGSLPHLRNIKNVSCLIVSMILIHLGTPTNSNHHVRRTQPNPIQPARPPWSNRPTGIIRRVASTSQPAPRRTQAAEISNEEAMSQSERARITLWNAIEAAETVGGQVVFDLTKVIALTNMMSDADASKFTFSETSYNQLKATRNP